jgi:hypothetical protein
LHYLCWRCGFDSTMNTLVENNTNVLKYDITLLWNFHVSYYLSWKLKALYVLWRTCSVHGGHIAQNIWSASTSMWEFWCNYSLCLEFIDCVTFSDKQICSRKRRLSSRVKMAMQICVWLQCNCGRKDGVFLNLRWIHRLVVGNKQCTLYY